MKLRLKLAALLMLVCGTLAGCAHDPFSRCDNRPSLADWFDEYGPLGCSCNQGNCNSCNCNR